MNSPQGLAPDARLLVAIPNWVGDVVLATPVLAALRTHLAGGQITYLMRRYVREILAGAGWHDEERYWPDKSGGVSALWRLAGELAADRHDAVLLLTNSFRSGLVSFLARIPRRIGYARDGRSWLLTDRLRPNKENGQFVPGSVLPYYCRLAEHVGCPVPDRALRLAVTAEEEAAAAELKAHHRFGESPYAVINPGAAFGAAKCWPADRFALLCDQLREKYGCACVIVGAPGEAKLMEAIAAAAKSGPVCCTQPGTTLGSLKPVIRDARLLVCNDTGPRHYGNAFGVPTLTIFGPTHQAWTDTAYAGEARLQIKVDCGPCQLRTCPLDHRCMTGISVETATEAIRALLESRESSRIQGPKPSS
ncbi:MAG: lipopolysaccharide heptosyltransferase II [Planctomycetes bacterium]|nr:lipopolysaccharide heptosyltransferase II [Planctomycetota bacterium]